MTKTRILALLLCLLMVTSVLAGCGSKDEPANEPAGTPSTDTPADAPVADTPADTPADEPSAEPGEITLPIVDEVVTFTAWQPDAPFIYPYLEGDWMETENISQIYLEELTGVHLEWVLAGDAAVDMSTRIASGEYPDLFFTGNSYYTGGESRGVEDEVFLVLDDYLDQVPNYKALLDSNDALRRQILTSEGNVASFYSVYDDVGGRAPNGPLARGDYMEALGYTVDTLRTYEQYHDFLTACYTEYGAQLYLPYSAVPDDNWLIGSYGVAGEYSSMQNVFPFYVVDGEVKFGVIEEGYKDYLTMIAQWYSEGIISDELVNYTMISRPDNDYVSKGGVSMFHWNAANVPDVTALATDPNMNYVGIKDAVFEGDEDSLTKFGVNSQLVNMAMQVSTTCENLDVLFQWCNFGYTEEGSRVWQYGRPGVTYELNDAGEPVYTDYIAANPKGAPLGISEIAFLACGAGPYVSVADRMYPYYQDFVVDAFTLWKESTDYDNSYWLPYNLSLMAEDSTEFNTLMSDISTLMDESIPQFMTGSKSMDEFDAFVEQIKAMDIQSCIDMYQRAYDNYMSK